MSKKKIFQRIKLKWNSLELYALSRKAIVHVEHLKMPLYSNGISCVSNKLSVDCERLRSVSRFVKR